SIGGTINSIGGTINSIGGTINSISAHSGTVSETIGTQLWLPGDYYVVVTTSNGEHSTTPYQLSVALTESGLGAPPPTPEVSLNPYALILPTPITTLYIYNSARMADVYGLAITDTNLVAISNSLTSLNRIQAPVEYGFMLNLNDLLPRNSNGLPIASLYSYWDANKANPLYANYIAGLIDHVIEAVTTDGVSGPGSVADYFAGQPDTGTGAPIYSPITFPKLRNIVLVGGDAVLPFYRVPDLTTIANEADYAAYLAALNANGIIDSNSAQGAALRYRMLLTDNPYGAGQPYRFYGYPFFLPHLAVGRIVEQPAQIARYLEYYAYPAGMYPPSTLQVNVTTGLPQSSAKRAFVSGYDFLQDEASQVKAVLEQTGLISSEITHLNDDIWQLPDVEQAWFDGRLATDFPNPTTTTVSGSAQIQLSSVNAHFDHWQLLPADITGGTLTAQRLLEPTYPGVFPHLYFGDTLGYSVGCHSGYSIADEAVPAMANQALYQADFPQALNAHGGNWVGNTGYGYGTADGIDYSERLAVLYTEELARTVVDTTGITLSATLGDALMNAKQRYVRNAASLTAYDYKVINIMTLYGLPFISAKFTNSLPPPAEDPLRHLPGTAPLETQAPKASNSLGRLTRTITFTIALTDTNFVDVQRTGSRILRLAPGDFQIDDEFFERGFGTLTNPADLLRVFENDQLGAPTLPTFAYDISALSSSPTTTTERLKVRDVVFVDGTYNALPGFNPQITQIVTDTTTPIIDTASEPNFAAGAGVWYPDKFFGFSSVGVGDQQFDQLTAFAAQLRADLNGTTGLLRPYTKMVFKVIYEDPTVQTAPALALNADTTAPVIQSVVVRPSLASNSLAAIGGTEVVVQASDG
ncbi:MAG: peptidase, partial [Chloroflexales bacterium]